MLSLLLFNNENPFETPALVIEMDAFLENLGYVGYNDILNPSTFCSAMFLFQEAPP